MIEYHYKLCDNCKLNNVQWQIRMRSVTSNRCCKYEKILTLGQISLPCQCSKDVQMAEVNNLKHIHSTHNKL